MLLFPAAFALNVKLPQRTDGSIFLEKSLRGIECSGEDRVGSNPSSIFYKLSDLGKDYVSSLTFTFFIYKMEKNNKTCLLGLL